MYVVLKVRIRFPLKKLLLRQILQFSLISSKNNDNLSYSTFWIKWGHLTFIFNRYVT